jgi:hypothetical protein
MSDYGDHRLYLYDDTIELVINSNGNLYVDNRPMNLRTLQAHKGVNNELFFTIRDRDRKLQNVFSDTLRAYLIEPLTKRRVFSKILSHNSVGKVKLTLTVGDLIDIESGLYHMYITRTNQEDQDLPVYNDQNNNIRFDINITDQTGVEPIPTQQNSTFLQTGNVLLGSDTDIFVTNAMLGNLDHNFSNAQHTVAIYADGYTGEIEIQASCLLNTPNTDHNSKDWFLVDTLSIDNLTGIAHKTFQVNCNWVRIVHRPVSGTITKVLFRN